METPAASAPEAGWSPATWYCVSPTVAATSGGDAAVSEDSLLGRVRFRLGVGGCLRARRPALLPQARIRRALHARTEPSAAAADRGGRGGGNLALAHGAVHLAGELGYSSLHVQFPLAERDHQTLEAAGLLLRKDCQFHWHNARLRSFDDFLATFTVRRSARRRAATAASVSRTGYPLSLADGRRARRKAIWRDVYELISTTFWLRGDPCPTTTSDFFREVSSRTLPESILVILAETGSEPIAAAVFFAANRLFTAATGAATATTTALHFETCYYQGIEYCIREGKQTFRTRYPGRTQDQSRLFAGERRGPRTGSSTRIFRQRP